MLELFSTRLYNCIQFSAGFLNRILQSRIFEMRENGVKWRTYYD